MGRRASLAAVLAASAAFALLGSACTGGYGATPTDVPNRGGAITLTHSAIAGGLPAQAALAVGAFFAPPGPAESDPWPASGVCQVVTPTPTPSAAPTAATDFHDAGAIVTLASPSASLDLDRFASADGTILYVSGTIDPTTIAPTDVFALSFPGGSGAHALPPATLAGAITMPTALALSGPDFSSGNVTLPGAFFITWASFTAGDVQIRLAVAGSSGAVAVICTAPDTGSFQVAASLVSSLPSGTGQLSVTRRTTTTTELTPSTVLVGTGRWVEGGVVRIP